jgi:hypothetical protein
MIALPPGCTVAYGVRVDVDKLTSDMIDWFITIGGQVNERSHYRNRKGYEIKEYQVAYGGGKFSHTESSGVTRVHFLGKDAGVASMFLLKFNERVTYHNLKEANETYHY